MSYIGNSPKSATFAIDTFNGNGVTVNFTLRDSPVSTSSILVFVGGVRQATDAYSLSGTTLTFSEAPPSGTNNIQVLFLGLGASPTIPSDGSVTGLKLADGAVTGPKLGQTAIRANNIAASAITGDKIASATIGSSNLTTTGVSAGTFGGSSNIPVITVDTAGRLSYAANVALSLNNVTGDFTVSEEARIGNSTLVANTKLDVYGGVSMNVVTLATTSNTINVALANYFVHSPAGTTTYVFEGVPASRDSSFVIELTNGGTYTINWPASVKWPANTAPTLTASGKDLVIFSTANTGSTWRGSTLLGYTG